MARLVVLGGIAGLCITVAVLARLDGPVGTPPIGSRALSDWVSDRTAEEIVFAAVRLLALLLAIYLLVTTTLAACVRLFRANALTELIDAATLPVIRRVVHSAIGISVAAGAIAATPHRQAFAAPVIAVAAEPTETPVMRWLDETSPEEVRPAAVQPMAAERVLVAGDHLWAVAEDALEEAWGRAPTDQEVVPYWLAVIEANRSRLRDPAQPDLVFPGQSMLVPTPPARPT